ncbi:PREDICTED: lipase member H-B-like isoform X2 [Vollenhovia emeryi]|uniref:lipase member H-B-like isoform X2 n=1 Tax=Vollenhovia emeryi TaxID=411798 RepID=UPI0005F46FAF|nr:PREDICTED: lipase member H-B-like isoform X2 [Vollenhovia emeryi]
MRLQRITMINRALRQCAVTIALIYATAVDGQSKEGAVSNLQSIFLRIYGTTLHEYVDYPLENVNAITSRIDNSKPTVMYVHGFTENVERKSVQTVVQAYLDRRDHNILAVDYGKLANDSYVNLAINAPLIGKVLATLFNEMKKSGVDTEKLHIVAHSMGSQIAGYIGRQVNFDIPRITGLDPAGPFFNVLLPSLSSNAARFVDTIHTDYGIYGVAKNTGTVDFFPNGGTRIQPGCPKHPTFYSNDDFCSHNRAWKLYAESLINESSFLGVQCSSISQFTSGNCNNNTQIFMGYATPRSAQGKVYLITNDRSPFGLSKQGAFISTN